MSEKCSICEEKIAVTFLDKIDGSYIRKNGKMKAVCSNCQRKFKDKITTML